MIEKLPDLPFWLIFSELNYADRFRLRRTCKTLKALIDGQVCRNLFVFLDCFPCHQSLFHTEEPIYYVDSCRVPRFDRFISSNYKENFKLLKKLTIFFEGGQPLNYLSKIELDPKYVDSGTFFQESWSLRIDVDDLNFLEQIEHLEIKVSRVQLLLCVFQFNSFSFAQGVGEIVGQLRLRKLRIMSVQSRRKSVFDLDCPALQAMRISFGARPNFIDHPHLLNCLSIKLLFFKDTYDYLRQLYFQCPNMSTIEFDYLPFMRWSLQEVNAGHISLPLWRSIKLERPTAKDLKFLENKLDDCLVEYEKSIKPDRLRIIFNGKRICSGQLLSIIKMHKDFTPESTDPYTIFLNSNERNYNPYLKFLREKDMLADCSLLYLGISKLTIADDLTVPDQSFVMKVKRLQELHFLGAPTGTDEMLFEKMLRTWTQLQTLWISNPGKQLSQHQLDQMPDHWPNLQTLGVDGKPDDLKFVARFKNLNFLRLYHHLPKEEMCLIYQSCPYLYIIEVVNKSTNSTNYRTSLYSPNYKTSLYFGQLRWRRKEKKHISWNYVVAMFREDNIAAIFSANHNYRIIHEQCFPLWRNFTLPGHYIPTFRTAEQMIDYYYLKEVFKNRGELERVGLQKITNIHIICAVASILILIWILMAIQLINYLQIMKL